MWDHNRRPGRFPTSNSTQTSQTNHPGDMSLRCSSSSHTTLGLSSSSVLGNNLAKPTTPFTWGNPSSYYSSCPLVPKAPSKRERATALLGGVARPVHKHFTLTAKRGVVFSGSCLFWYLCHVNSSCRVMASHVRQSGCQAGAGVQVPAA